MKNIRFLAVSFLLITFSCSGKTQTSESVNTTEQSQDTLDQLLSYFEKKGSAIPSQLCKEYLGIEYFDRAYSGCYSEERKRLGDKYLLVVKLSCMAGGSCESKRLFVIEDRKVKSQLQVGDNTSDMSFENLTTYQIISDSLIELQASKKEYEFDHDNDDDEGTLVVDTTFYEYHVVSESGVISKVKNEQSSQREYPETSYRVFNESELEEYSKEKLDIMRNEIFASYGYTFKTEKWKSYFESKTWYSPSTNDVNPLLTSIERVNIDRILKASK